MSGGTSGSDTKLCQPCSSQSNITQTRSSSEGSRKMRAPFDPCCLRFSAPLGTPTGLGPELVPGVEVLEVLPAVGHPAVFELEDDAVGDIQVLAVSVRGAALDADYAGVTLRSQVLQLGPEGPSGLLRQLAEVPQGRVAALIVIGHRAPAR